MVVDLKKYAEEKNEVNENLFLNINKIGGVTEWFKVADCKSVRFFYRRFESYFLHKLSKYDAVVACLFWEQKVMCSNHIISKV